MKVTILNNIKLSEEFIGEKTSIWNSNNAYAHNRVYVETEKDSISFDYWGSVSHPTIDSEYDLIFAFYCLLSDAIAGESDSTFDNFCKEFGYDQDNNSSKICYDECKDSFDKCTDLGLNIYDTLNYLIDKYDV